MPQWCVEKAVDDGSYGAVSFVHLAAAPDGSLYATLPMRGQVVHITDTDDDWLPDTPRVILDGLTRPLGIDYHNGALFIAGNANLYRYDIAADALTVLLDDLPFGWTGYPTGGVTVHDGRIYITTGGDAACTPGRGAIYSVALDGTERVTIATGIRAPADIAFFDGALWAIDTATDTLIRITPGADYGACSGTAPPHTIVHSFPPGSAPVSLAAYTHPLHTPLTGSLIVALEGTARDVTVRGYEVVAVSVANPQPRQIPVLPILPANLDLTEQKMHLQESGFYPHHVYGVTVDANGWLYIASGGGRIYALRGL